MEKARLVPRVMERALHNSYPDVASALAANGLAWGVEKRALFARIPSVDDPAHGVMKRADNLYGIVRTDNHATLGAVSGRYACIDNATALAPFDDLVRAGGLTVKGGSGVDGGSRVWMRADFAGIQVANHSISCGVIASFRHDGGGSLSYAPFFQRDSCFNPLQALHALLRELEGAWRGVMRFRHTVGVYEHLKPGVLNQQLETLGASRDAFKAKAQELLEASFSRAEMERLTRELLGERPAVTADNKREVNGWDARFEALMGTAWQADDLSDVRFTRWGALNAVSDYEAHLVPVKGDAARREERLAVRALDGGALTRQAAAILTA